MVRLLLVLVLFVFSALSSAKEGDSKSGYCDLIFNYGVVAFSEKAKGIEFSSALEAISLLVMRDEFYLSLGEYDREKFLSFIRRLYESVWSGDIENERELGSYLGSYCNSAAHFGAILAEKLIPVCSQMGQNYESVSRYKKSGLTKAEVKNELGVIFRGDAIKRGKLELNRAAFWGDIVDTVYAYATSESPSVLGERIYSFCIKENLASSKR